MPVIALAIVGNVLAYIDPVGGSILLQAILSGAVGAFVYFFRPILRFFGFIKKSSSPVEPAEGAEIKPEEPPKA